MGSNIHKEITSYHIPLWGLTYTRKLQRIKFLYGATAPRPQLNSERSQMRFPSKFHATAHFIYTMVPYYEIILLN